MQQYRIRDGVGFSLIRSRTIVLDIDADRYWQLDAAAGAVLTRLRDGQAIATETKLQRLIELGLVVAQSSTGSSAMELPPAPLGSALEAGWHRLQTRLPILLEIAAGHLHARAALRMRPLRAVLEQVVRRRLSSPPQPGGDIAHIARVFAHHRTLLPFAPACLPDSLAFLAFAMRRGAHARLVFGVEAYPFSAHCWVQRDDVVLTDVLDHARMFAPLLAI